MNDYRATYTVCLNCLKRLTLNSSLCFVNFLMTIFNKTIIGLCQLFIFVLILVIIYFIDPLFILFPNLSPYFIFPAQNKTTFSRYLHGSGHRGSKTLRRIKRSISIKSKLLPGKSLASTVKISWKV